MKQEAKSPIRKKDRLEKKRKEDRETEEGGMKEENTNKEYFIWALLT